MVRIHSCKKLKKLLICIASIIVYNCINNNKIAHNNNARKLELNNNDDNNDVKGKCYIIGTTAKGDSSWGNGVYYYITVINYFLRKGAIYVKLRSTPGRVPIGVVNIADVAYGPKASADFDESACIILKGGRDYHKYIGAMWDFMNLREQWDDIVKYWPKGPNINQSPFKTDFGVYPSLQDVLLIFGVNVEEVIVVHIRQGDVMSMINERHMFVHTQPPCAYYEDVIETGYNGGHFPYVLIITNKIADRNPNLINICDQYLEDRYKSGHHGTKLLNYNFVTNRLHTKDTTHAGPAKGNEGLRKDLFILTEAINVAEGHSSFTIGTTMVNFNLKRHFYTSAPATITGFLQTTRSIDGKSLYQRQFYLPNIEQTLYVLNGWLGFDGSCKAYQGDIDTFNIQHPQAQFQINGERQVREWAETKRTNFTEQLLNYDRSLISKFKSTNKPFKCDSVSKMRDNPSWFIPCKCN